ncbi:MAG TPA: LLM class flavin-dependent oxidoreductase [Chloroflexota bacterium]|nr:LLM class flavin-dependent oxidoreductase [Chloroflexota bacterium]
MKVFVFDLLPYGENLDHLKEGKELPWPLPKKHINPEVAARTYAEHLEAWEALDRLGYDGVGFNEHHTSPYGLMNSPNLMAAAVSQRTKNLKLLIYGNLLPLHNPIRLAEELAMLDCMSNGRIIAGFARGIPREYNVFGVPLPESRARFEEAFEIIRGAWTEEVFNYQGKFWSYKDVALWPRPLQQPHPPVWVPVTSSKETIEWAARNDVPITPGIGPRGLREDVVRYYAKCLAQSGHPITPSHLILPINAYIADSKEQAIKEAGPYTLYFQRTLFSHGNITEANLQRDAGYLSSASFDYVRPENLKFAQRAREDYRDMTMEDLGRQAETWPWGTAGEVAQRIIDEVDHVGAEVILVSMNRGGLPHELFMEQIERFASQVLPKLRAHNVVSVRLADEVAA